MAVRFDPSTLEASGVPVAVQGNVREATRNGDWDLSPEGSLAFVEQSRDVYMRRLTWMDRAGTPTPLPDLAPAYYQSPVISPDGQRVAFMVTGDTTDVGVYDFARKVMTLETVTTQGSSQYPVWWGNDRLIYRGTRAGTRDLYWRRVGGTSPEERLLTLAAAQRAPQSLSRDGRWLAVNETGGRQQRLVLFALPDDGTRPQVVREVPLITQANISPDGRLVAYVASSRAGRPEVYVETVAETDVRWQVSSDGGNNPVWHPNGHELFFRSGTSIMVAELTSGNPIRTLAPHKLFEASVFPNEPTVDYDVHPDGRFLIVQPTGPAPPVTHLSLVINWHETLNTLLPPSR